MLVSVAVLSWRARLVRLVGVAQCFGLVRRLDTAIGLDFEIVCDPLRSAPRNFSDILRFYREVPCVKLRTV